MSQCESAIKQWIWKYNCNGWKFTSDRTILLSGHKILSLSSSCLMRNFHKLWTKAVLNYVLYAQNNVTFATVLSLSSFVHKLARVAVIATCNSVNMCHFEVSGSSPSFVYNAKEFLVVHAPWSGMNLDVCTLPYEFLTEQFGFLQQFSNEFRLLLHIVLQLATNWEKNQTKCQYHVSTCICNSSIPRSFYPSFICIGNNTQKRSSVKKFNVKAYKYSWEWSCVDVGGVGSNQITY